MGIPTRIRLLTLGSILVTAVTIGMIALLGGRSLLLQAQSQSVAHRAESEAEKLRVQLQEPQHDTRLLASLPITRELLSLAQAGSDYPAFEEGQRQLAEIFRRVLESKPCYSQVRLITFAGGGREVVRVNRIGDRIQMVGRDQLQAKGGRAYTRGVRETPPGKIYLSEVTLNRERGRLDVPHRAMARMAVRIDCPESGPLGFVIINIDFGEVVRSLTAGLEADETLYVTNDRGDYLVHPRPDWVFGFDLGRRRLVQQEWNGVEAILANETRGDASLSVDRDDGEQLNLRRVALLPDDPTRFLLVGVSKNRHAIRRSVAGYLLWGGAATLLLCVLAAALGVYAGRLQTVPLRRVTHAALRVAQGEELRDLPVLLDNEFGELARAVQGMNLSLRQRGEELRRVNENLELANNDLEHFVHIASHDLREPLQKQRKLIDLIELPVLATRGADDQNQELLTRVKDCSSRMQSLVDEFRGLTHARTFESARAEVGLRDVIADVLEQHGEELERRGVATEFDPFPETIQAYPGLLRILYDNLVKNALRYAEHDGFTLRFTAEQTSRHWTFGVLNTGSAIPADKLDEVFKLFRTCAERTHGSGVGLSICRKIVQRHRGRIQAHSDHDNVHITFTLEETDDNPACQ